MRVRNPHAAIAALVAAALVAAALVAACLCGCAGGGSGSEGPPRPRETFTWLRQPIEFEPPPAAWRREGERSGGMLGVRFILTGGVGEVIEVAGDRILAERDRRDVIQQLIA